MKRIALVCTFLIALASCSNDYTRERKSIENDPVIREYLAEWQKEHPDYVVRSKVATISKDCVCYALEFIKKGENKAGILDEIKDRVIAFKDRIILEDNIKRRIKIILPQGWHVYVEDGEDACRSRCRAAVYSARRKSSF